MNVKAAVCTRFDKFSSDRDMYTGRYHSSCQSHAGTADRIYYPWRSSFELGLSIAWPCAELMTSTAFTHTHIHTLTYTHSHTHNTYQYTQLDELVVFICQHAQVTQQPWTTVSAIVDWVDRSCSTHQPASCTPWLAHTHAACLLIRAGPWM